MSVRYVLMTASKDMRGIIARLFMPMMHCPSFIIAMRLVKVSIAVKGKHKVYRQDEIENYHDEIHT